MRWRPSYSCALAAVLLVACTDATTIPTSPRPAEALPSLEVSAAAATDPISFCNPTGFSIVDGSSTAPARSSIAVSGLGAGPFKVTVTVKGLSHPTVGHLRTEVVGPTNVTVVLFAGVGGSADFINATIVVDDDAPSGFPPANTVSVIPSGAYKPTAGGQAGPFLSAFTGTDPNGTWKLYVWDLFLAGGTGSSSGGWCVTFALLNTAPVAAAGGPYAGAEGSSIAFDGTGSSDPDGEPIASYTWDFGDGGTGTGPTPEHTYAASGIYTVKLTVTDATGASGEATTTATISDVAPTATFVAPASANEGTSATIALTSPSVADARYAFDCGDGSGFGSIGAAATRTCPLGDNGEVTFKGRVIDPAIDDLFTEYSAVVNVDNVAPALAALSGPADPHAVGGSVSVSATYADPGPLDTHTASVAWGDGATSAGTAVGGTAAATHVYTTPGVYTVRMTVTDDDGGVSNESAFQYVVVYDPNGGFVTGGGWIVSPQGAYATDPALTGRATFGFVSKYLPGANKPSGSTEFQFKAGELRFRSASYDWLVVSGARAQFKGEGSVNGTSGYGFLLTAIDGQVAGGGGSDKFRIKIWNLATGAIVYDNDLGESDDSNAATALGGGSIVIHK